VWASLSAIANRVLGRRSARAFPEPTVDGIAGALRACRSDKELEKLHRWARSIITPLEAAALLQIADRLPPRSQAWISNIAAFGEFATVAPQRYERRPLAKNIDIYSDPSTPREQKNLIIGFSGAAGQLMFPTPALLQYLPSDRYDVVVLRDRNKRAYVFGIPPYANSLWELIQKLTAELDAESYRRIYPFGTSMGGFAALRCGILLKTETAISCGGQFPSFPEFIMRNRKLNLASFDPLCACNVETTTRLICCHSTNYPIDIHSVDMLQRIVPIERVPIEAPGHAFPETLWEQGRLRAFYDRMFDNEPVEAPADRCAQADRVA
jgi:hypothetical protein